MMCLLSVSARADLIIPGTHVDHPIVVGSLADVRLQVGLSVSGGVATFTFTNASIYPEESAVLEQIVLDTIDDDRPVGDPLRVILSNPSITGGSPGLDYSIDTAPTLPGYNDVLKDDVGMVGFEAEKNNAIDPGEWLIVQFDTSLANGSDIDDYLGAFNGGGDTDVYSMGFHAISADVVDGESLSGTVPEPATLGVLLLGAGAMLLRQTRRLR